MQTADSTQIIFKLSNYDISLTYNEMLTYFILSNIPELEN